MVGNETECEYEQLLLSLYLKHGSVDAVLQKTYYGLPFSESSIHRVLDRYGVVKSPSKNSRLDEVLAFMSYLAETKLPLEALYQKMPPNFQTSAQTLHRILSLVKKGLTRRVATAIIIYPEGNPEQFLIAKENSESNFSLGKLKGSYSIPMTFSKKNESYQQSVLRVLQQEVFAQALVEQKFPYEIIPERPDPFWEVNILDIKLAVFSLPVTLDHSQKFSSFRLADHRFVSREGLEESDIQLRPGILEIAEAYEQSLVGHEIEKNVVDLNLNLVGSLR